MKKYIKNARLFIKDRFLPGGILFDEKIERIDLGTCSGPESAQAGLDADIAGDSANAGSEAEVIDARGAYVIPGLIDVHTHAAVGEDASDGSSSGIEKMCLYYAKEGVTSFFPTTMTLMEPDLTRAMEAIRDHHRPKGGAKVAGIHLEGPFINVEKKGAQNAANVHKPDIDMLHRLVEASGGLVKTLTLAPEECGPDMNFIREASRFCKVSIGHTTADYDTAAKAFLSGASRATHLFNAMPPFAHRNPGVVGAALDAGAFVELITDGLHIHPSVIRFVFEAFGDKVCLISDSLRCAGMPDGEYELGGLPVTLKDGKCTLTGTDTLAGSSIHLMEGIRRSVSFGISLEKAIYAATTAPARAMGLIHRTGALKTGLLADIVILGDDLSVQSVFIEGRH